MIAQPPLFENNCLSIDDGLRTVEQAFAARSIRVASITLYRGDRTYKHPIDENQPGVQRTIEAASGDNKIVVAVTPAVAGDLFPELQAVTTAAAEQALSWIEPSTATDSRKLLESSATMRRLNEAIARVAKSNHVVLITGESGTGKTTAAELIHQRSRRAAAPFVDINCAALPETLIESELFGYEKGAFTGAANLKKGLFEVAEGGTLFLDEIGELKLELQAKLLKAIEQKKVRRLGSTKDLPCDVRILAASSRDLQRMVKDGLFREDLFYRLAVLQVDIRPLRDRQDDIRELITKQLQIEEQNTEFTEALRLDTRAFNELVAYSWPGNIRQLFNALARLACHTPTPIISLAHVRSELSCFKNIDSDTILLPQDCNTLLAGETLEHLLHRIRAAAIQVVKERSNGRNVSD